MTESLPLTGLNIVVTRPREQSSELARNIEKLGGTCIIFPLLEISPLLDEQPLHDLIERLHEFHLAVFISPNAVRFGMAAIQKAGGLPATLQVATVGAGSAKALFDYGVSGVITPRQRFDSESLLALDALQNVSGKRVAIFRGDSGRELLGDTLKQRGATVEYVTCYHRSKPQHDMTTLLAARPDVLSVSSSEALNNLWDMLSPPLRELVTNIPLFVSHERIAAAAQRLGWHNIVTAAGGDESLLSGLLAWAVHRRKINHE